MPGALKGPGRCRVGAHRLLNPLSPLSKWKLIDNLRRSLVPPALTLLLVLGWGLFASPGWWTLSLIGILLLPAICAALLDLLRKPDECLCASTSAPFGIRFCGVSCSLASSSPACPTRRSIAL